MMGIIIKRRRAAVSGSYTRVVSVARKAIDASHKYAILEERNGKFTYVNTGKDAFMFISRQTHEEFNGMWAELTLEATPGGVDLLLELRVRPTGLLGIAMLLFLSSTFPPVVVRGLMIDWPSHTLAYNMTGTTIGTIAVAALAFVFQLLVRRALREVRRHLKLFDELAAAAGNPSEEVTA